MISARLNGVTIRRLTRRDLRKAVEAIMRSYGMSGEEGLRLAELSLELQLDAEPLGCVAAVAEDSVIGTACYTCYGSIAWVGLVGVIPEWRRRGVGTALMSEVLMRLRDRGVATVRLDSTDEGLRLYSRLGFTPEYRTVLWEIPEGVRRPRRLTIAVRADSIPAWVAALDRLAFGACRLKVISVRLRRGGKLLLLPPDRGYALVFEGTIGPVIARDAGSAEELILAAASLGGRRVVAPDGNPAAIDLLESLGASVRTTCVRMRLGPPAGERVGMIYGILSFAKG